MTWTIEPPTLEGAIGALEGIKDGVARGEPIPVAAIIVAARETRQIEHQIAGALISRGYVYAAEHNEYAAPRTSGPSAQYPWPVLKEAEPA